jgi:DNA-binding MarR family transcriptional regulator
MPDPRVQRFILKTNRTNLITLVQRMTNQMGIALDKAELGVDLLEAQVLAQLAETGTSTYAELHRAIGHKRNVLTTTLDHLQERELITRRLSDVDRGTLIVDLTPAGRLCARRVQSWLRHFESDLLAHIDGDDLEGMDAVARAFSKVIAALAKPNTNGPHPGS